MPKIFEHPHRVAAQDIDNLGHANNQAYLAWMMTAAEAHTAAQGWPEAKQLAFGACWVVRKHEIEYLNSAKIEDEIVIRTWVSAMERISAERRYEILRAADSKLLAKAASLFVLIDMKTGRPTRIPAEIASAFEVAA